MTEINYLKKYETRHSITLENNGRKIFGMLHLPNVKGVQVPGVMICHGLAGEKTGKHRVYVDLASSLAERGIATFRFDYRGCGDSEGELTDVTPEDHYSDALLCLDFFSKYKCVDAERVGLFARSFGGVVATRTAREAGIIKSLVYWCPMFDGEQWRDNWQLIQTGSLDENQLRKMLQFEGQQGSFEFFQQFFNIDVTDDFRQLQHIPFLHIHGEIDTQVDMLHAVKYEQCRKNAAAPSKFVKLPNTDHSFSDIEEREDAIEQTVAWFSAILGAEHK